MDLQQLKSHLWNCAETLRGSAVDRTDWKGYILPLLFFKRNLTPTQLERGQAWPVKFIFSCSLPETNTSGS
jgi:type I restriction enzyme M protein